MCVRQKLGRNLDRARTGRLAERLVNRACCSRSSALNAEPPEKAITPIVSISIDVRLIMLSSIRNVDSRCGRALVNRI
jgi:hypothetical protein